MSDSRGGDPGDRAAESARGEDPRALVAACVALEAATVDGLSPAEREWIAAAAPCAAEVDVDRLRAEIAVGRDPLGEAFSRARSAAERRRRGATYTPPAMVEAMVAWARPRVDPVRVIDPGVGSARFLIAAGRAFPAAALIGVEIDPLAALIARANLAATGMARRARVEVADFRHLALERTAGPTLFLGNPPYVRHHQLSPADKQWLKTLAARHGLAVSGRAGLHVHFLLATLAHARAGDLGVYVTAAEWLDTDYGKLARGLLAGPLGLDSLRVVDPVALPFDGAQTTAAVAGFRVGAAPDPVEVARVAAVAELIRPLRPRHVARARLGAARWSALSAPPRARPAGFVELGELCRVHRGQVTGSNRTWLVDRSRPDLPASLVVPVVSRAVEIFAAGPALADGAGLRGLVALPADLDRLEREARAAVDRFLARARAAGVDAGYVAAHRRVWWSIPLRPPAPILATYMARRPPAFVRNLCAAHHINIAHGLYPRQPMADGALDALAAFLRTGVVAGDGRTYAGGLTKFEPREMERLWVPGPERLPAGGDGRG